MTRRVAGRPHDLELALIDRQPLRTFEERVRLNHRHKFAGCHRCGLHEFGFCRGNAVLTQPLGDIMHEVLRSRVARFHERHFQAMDHQFGTGSFAQLASQAKMVGMDVRDEDPVDPIDRNLQCGQFLVQRLPRFFGLKPGIDQGEMVTVAQKIDVDMLQLKRHGEL